MSVEPNEAETLAGTLRSDLMLQDLRVTFVGKLGAMNRREAKKLVRENGGVPVASTDDSIDLLVIGADELPVASDDFLDDHKLQLAAEGRLEIIGETQFWQRLGKLVSENHVRKLYTPAMLAELLDTSVSNIKRWYREELIVAAKVVNRLPYFDFQEISVARQLAKLVAAGESVASIETKLARLAEFLPNTDRPLTQLSVLIEGRDILMRQGEGLVEPGGQLRIDFDSFEESQSANAATTVSMVDGFDKGSEETHGDERAPETLGDFLDLAADLEDQDELDQAIEVYRAALFALGANPEICFRMGEIFVLLGELAAARERYFMAIELDAAYIEARANLGCVLMDLGQIDLAIASFQGALEHHNEYPDVHFHLARIYDDRMQGEIAESHWQQFLELAPQSPWADEARERLGVEINLGI